VFIARPTLDGLLREVFETLLAQPETVTAHKGDFKEVIGACLHLTDPLGRLSRTEAKGKIYSALGEFLWYLTGDTLLEFIEYYVPNQFRKESDDGVRVRGGYGDRLRSWRGLDQLNNVIQMLKDPKAVTTRRAVIQLFDATDIDKRYASIPCTCTLQFLAREGRLHLFVAMRSNDAYLGLPHDVFAFTMLQELVARSAGLELGEYKHCAGSLHLYHKNLDQARSYMAEGWQDPAPMPAMPDGDPWANMKWLQSVEVAARLNTSSVPVVESSGVEDYWKDLARLLLSLRASKDHDLARLAQLKDELHFPVYKPFLMARMDHVQARQVERAQ
jgi:thymidylate synthase